MQTPNGLQEVIKTFGNIYDYVATDGTLSSEWEREFLTIIQLPFEMKLSWNTDLIVSRMTCHVLLGDIFKQVFQTILDKGLQTDVTTYGGCFTYRPKRVSNRLSLHSWGIAIDINPVENMQGTIGHMNPDIIEVFKNAGFIWGGDWSGKSKDPMHFQYAENY